VDARDKRGHDDPMKSELAVQRVSAAPREATNPGVFSTLFVRPGRLPFKRDLFQKDHALKIRLAGQAACRWRPQAGAYDPGLGSHRMVLILDRRQFGYELLAIPA
jgi:hypothetical protein